MALLYTSVGMQFARGSFRHGRHTPRRARTRVRATRPVRVEGLFEAAYKHIKCVRSAFFLLRFVAAFFGGVGCALGSGLPLVRVILGVFADIRCFCLAT